MSTGRRAVFRCDASPAIGLGHIMRCWSLAEALEKRGWQCLVAATAESARIVSADHISITLPNARALDPQALIAALPGGCDLLVTDGYRLNAEFESACRPWAKSILAIDDLANRPHDCDVLLDQTHGRGAADYARHVPPGCRLLLGSRYALLRPQFALERPAALARRATLGNVRRILVSMGGTDPDNITGVVLDALRLSRLSVDIDVVMGGAAPHLAEVCRRATVLGAKVHVNVSDMARMMAAADLAIGASGVTAWERCCLGLPTILVITAENQRAIAAALEGDAAVLAGDAAELRAPALAAVIAALATDTGRLHAMTQAAAAVCDGRGTERVARVCEALTAPVRKGAAGALPARDGRPVTLRPCGWDDVECLLAWQHLPETRRYARHPAAPTADEHRAWFRHCLEDPDCILQMVEHDREAAGSLRLDRVGGGRWEINIYIDPRRYRLGIATAALRLARQLLPEADFIAFVLPDNVASHQLFRKAGYRPSLADGWYESFGPAQEVS